MCYLLFLCFWNKTRIIVLYHIQLCNLTYLKMNFFFLQVKNTWRHYHTNHFYGVLFSGIYYICIAVEHISRTSLILQNWNSSLNSSLLLAPPSPDNHRSALLVENSMSILKETFSRWFEGLFSTEDRTTPYQLLKLGRYLLVLKKKWDKYFTILVSVGTLQPGLWCSEIGGKQGSETKSCQECWENACALLGIGWDGCGGDALWRQHL